MFLKRLDLTTALRPQYLPDEDLLFVQDNVGLYEGKYKLLNHQNGQVYLTSHRVCYVDQADPRRYSVAVDLKDVERYEFYAGFLKSSPKVTLVPKPAKVKRSSTAPSDDPARPGLPPAAAATWVCPICSFANPVPSNFDAESLSAHTLMPLCLACGVRPTMTHVLKAVIAAATATAGGATTSAAGATGAATAAGATRPATATTSTTSTTPPPDAPLSADPDASFQCPRCTFLTHPSLLACEMCGAPLVSRDLPAELTGARQLRRTESPGPATAGAVLSGTGTGTGTATTSAAGADAAESIKLSFRGGGDKIFYERLKGALAQRKWLLQNAPPIPSRAGTNGGGGGGGGGDVPAGAVVPGSGSATAAATASSKTAGIAGLEKRGLDLRKKNELVIGSAFEDLEALMASAKQIVALAEQLAQQTGSSTATSTAAASAGSQLGLITTRDIVGSSGSSSSSLYLSELARNLAEFLTDDARGVLRRAGGIMSLVDVWAVFNRARGGVELVSPMDFAKAARLWETLRLPVRLRTFKRSGVLVVQGRDRTDEATVRALLGWLRDLRAVPPAERGAPDVAWDWRAFGCGVNAQETAERFGWSIGVAEEELEMAEERGALCREEGIAGLRFWENLIVEGGDGGDGGDGGGDGGR